jgi:hypothetical protein
MAFPKFLRMALGCLLAGIAASSLAVPAPRAGEEAKGDKLHFDAASLREFGRRYAEVYLKLAAPK